MGVVQMAQLQRCYHGRCSRWAAIGRSLRGTAGAQLGSPSPRARTPVFDDLKIRNKLVLLVAGPIVIIVLLAALGARSRQGTADASRQVERLVAVAQANSNVVDALQQEALYSTAYVGSARTDWKGDLTKTRAATDAAMTESLKQLRDNLGTSSGFRSASTLAIDAADKLTYIRQTVDQGYRWDQVATTYSSLQGTFLSVNDTIPEIVTDPQVSGQLRTGASLAAYKAAVARQASLLVGAAEQGGFTVEGSFGLLKTAVADESSQKAIFDSIAASGRKGDVRDALTSESRITLEAARDAAIAGGADGTVGGDPKVLVKAASTVLKDVHAVEVQLFTAMIAQSKAGRSDAQQAANLFLGSAVLAVLAAAVGAVLLGRRITVPLNRLTEAADRLATDQMPRLVESLRNPSEDEVAFQLGSLQAIEVTSKDEIGRLTNSFNDVQRVAGEVAAEQAALLRKGIGEMFVNLARRNQALLDRQIEFIDELERGEEDPDQLENLYRLDHLATRMRRNAESLLVLAGAEPPRRRGRPAPLANIVRAALAEVEDFGRIELLSFDEILVASNAAADLAHLLSELMENATNFSPPETQVEVVGHRTNADGYVISVTDHGIGMSSDQVLEANESLAKPPLVGLALSRSLGFIVVGRLAGRHGIAVRMMPSPSGGVTAVVSIPPSLVTDAVGQGARPPERPASETTGQLRPVLDTPSPAPEPSSSESGVAPISFTPYDPSGGDKGPATLADAVPTGLAFDEGLEGLMAPPSGPTVSEPGAPTSEGGLPTRRLSAAPAPPPNPAADPIGFAPEPARQASPGPISFGALPEEVGFATSMGSDLLGDEPTAPSTKAARLDGPPPSVAGLASRPPATRPVESAPAGGPASGPGPKPFFLEDAEPPRLFGRTPAPASESPPERPAVLAPTPAATPAPAPPEPVAKAAPLVRRAPPEPPKSVPSEPVLTTSGLAKRSPRQAGEGGRAIPGADAERGVSATRRSPDEVRNLLSRYRDGQQRARVEESVPAGPPEEKETP